MPRRRRRRRGGTADGRGGHVQGALHGQPAHRPPGPMAIDATFGLGEALVSGLVEPSHVVADTTTGRFLERTLGAKAVVTSSLTRGGVETRRERPRPESTLSEADVAALVDLGDGSRRTRHRPRHRVGDRRRRGRPAPGPAITSFPLPAGPEEAVYPRSVRSRACTRRRSPSAATPSPSSSAGGASVFGTSLEPKNKPWIGTAGERLWIRIDRALRIRWAAPSCPGCSRQSTRAPGGSSSGCATRGPRAPPPRGHALRGAQAGAVRSRRRPQPRRAVRDRRASGGVRQGHRGRGAARDQAFGGPRSNPTRSAGSPPAPGPCAGPLRRLPHRRPLRQRRHRRPGAGAAGPHPAPGATTRATTGVPLVLEVARALPHNVTTEMTWPSGKSPRRFATTLESEPGRGPPPAEPRTGMAGRLGPASAAPWTGSSPRTGCAASARSTSAARGGATTRPTCRPTLQSYQADQSPPAQFARGEQAAERVISFFALPRQRGGRLVGFLAGRIRVLAGGRELPKFTIIRMMGVASYRPARLGSRPRGRRGPRLTR